MHPELQTDSGNAVWLDHTCLVSVGMLADLSGLSERDVVELIELGAIAPADPAVKPWTFSAECIVTVRTAKRLRRDLELDTHALALALSLLERIRRLEHELAGLRAQMPAG
jgi:chaperone modulatory protein CbpM